MNANSSHVVALIEFGIDGNHYVIDSLIYNQGPHTHPLDHLESSNKTIGISLQKEEHRIEQRFSIQQNRST